MLLERPLKRSKNPTRGRWLLSKPPPLPGLPPQRLNIDRCIIVKTPCLFYFRSVKFHYVKETYDINSLLTLVKIVVASHRSAQKTTKQNLCQDLLTIENTDSDLKVHALLYANELLVRIRLAFQKLLQTRQTRRSNKKLCKKGFWLWLSIV